MLAPLALVGRMGLGLAMAIVVGLAFEGIYKREERSSPGGIRTFPLLAVLGTLLYLLDPKSLLPLLAGLGAVALWLYAHLRSDPAANLSKAGLVVPCTNLLAYALGPVALTQPPWIVVTVAVIAVLLLESREPLHRIVREIPADEVFTLGKFLILIGIVLPLVPDHPIAEWTPITPYRAWLALVAVSSLSYVSYLLRRYLPGRLGGLWMAVLGGAYSSTATTVALAREQRQLGTASRTIEIGIVIATAVMYIRIGVVVALFNAQLAWSLVPALAGSFILAAATAGWTALRRPQAVTPPPAKLAVSNPLQLGTAVTFAALFVTLAIASAWVNHTFGQRGVYALAGVSGLVDIDPFVLSLAQGGAPGLTLEAAATAIIISASCNNVVKACYAFAFGGGRAALRPALALLALGAAGIGLALIYHSY